MPPRVSTISYTFFLLMLFCQQTYSVRLDQSKLVKNAVSKVHKIVASTSIAFTGQVLPISSTRTQMRSPAELHQSTRAANAETMTNRMAKDTTKTTTSSERTTKKSRPSFITQAVRSVGSSVARIDCERVVFSEQNQEGTVHRIAGSGVITSKNGFILTNAHVVEKSRKLTVTLSNGRVYSAKIVSIDALQDLAVLKADVGSDELKPAPFGDSSTLQSGDWVIAVGCPVGLDFTVTLGIVSNPRRTAIEVGASHLKGMFIQTDAALNHGNSGGPLVNQDGEVIGINTLVRSNTEAIGFAIPINSAMSSYEVLKEGLIPMHSFFGLDVMTVSPDWAKIQNDDPNGIRLPEKQGALVKRIVPGSPAALGGLRRYDVILEVDGKKVKNSEEAQLQMDSCKPGVPISIKIARGENGGSLSLTITPQDLLTMLEQRKIKVGSTPVSA